MAELVFQCSPEVFLEKEKTYIEMRRKEGRLPENDAVAKLPVVPHRHPHRREWQIRQKNLAQFQAYWRGRNGPLRILDLGCGNGWMSRHLAGLPGARVTGMDLNRTELLQAVEVFGHLSNLQFVYGDIFGELPGHRYDYDCIVMAASFQYFPDPDRLMARLFELLDGKGEIHILETMFYAPEEVSAARERTKVYYQSVGQPDMAGYYHHHQLDAMLKLGAEILYDPRLKRSRWKRPHSPFFWLKFARPDV